MKLLNVFLSILISTVLIGCTTKHEQATVDEKKAWDEHVKKYKKHLEIPAPNIWSKDSLWSFVYVDANDEIVRRVHVRITNEPVRACVSGDWYILQILSEAPTRRPISPNTKDIAAYSIEGSNLSFMLRANVCDGGMDVLGTVSESGFVGKEDLSPWPCLDDCLTEMPAFNRVYGVPVKI
ncbi:hypothetical protein [Thalassomonas sp. M1454]|uniref:hypothetical protein n=1 Tax=Thalassomonas sp. M1454 TaxID=2594477 RepID=UPI00117E6D82|nr:hypothetical protein [Thalassomonas sp. M1454]TRX55156.1 hypothetical protein FNN08_11240 [Thalassomonas sp. M1454]